MTNHKSYLLISQKPKEFFFKNEKHQTLSLFLFRINKKERESAI